jgi:hypothetical protein
MCLRIIVHPTIKKRVSSENATNMSEKSEERRRRENDGANLKSPMQAPIAQESKI